MGCGGSKEDVAVNQSAHALVTSVDQSKLAEKTKELEERDETRIQNQAAAKMAEKEKEANKAAAEGIAHKISASLADKEIEKVNSLPCYSYEKF